MDNELSFLIELQSHDNTLDTLSEKIIDVQNKIKDKTALIDSLKQGSKTVRENLAALQLKKKQLEADADNQEKLVKKHQAELNSLKTNDAYKAMLAEIDTAKKSQIKIEDEILVIMEQVDLAEKKLKEFELKLKSDEAKIKNEIQLLEATRLEINSELQQRKGARDIFAGTVPDNVKRQYENLRRIKAGLAIVPVIHNACSGCQMALPHSKIMDIKKAKAMVLCESCSRILFIPKEASPEKPSESASVPIA